MLKDLTCEELKMSKLEVPWPDFITQGVSLCRDVVYSVLLPAFRIVIRAREAFVSILCPALPHYYDVVKGLKLPNSSTTSGQMASSRATSHARTESCRATKVTRTQSIGSLDLEYLEERRRGGCRLCRRPQFRCGTDYARHISR